MRARACSHGQVKVSESRSNENYKQASRLQEDAVQERIRLQETFARMELTLREQRQQCERDKIRLDQESARIRVMQETAEQERERTMLQLEEERTRVQVERDRAMDERRSVLVGHANRPVLLR